MDLRQKHILIDSLLDVATLILSEKYFARDYLSKYPLSLDIEQLRNQCSITGFSQVEDARIDYLLKQCQSAESLNSGKRMDSNSFSFKANRGSGNLKSQSTSVMTSTDEQQSVQQQKRPQLKTKLDKKSTESVPDAASEQVSIGKDSTTESGVEEVELLSLISGVKDILPDFGDGFIQLCLEEFAFNQELALNALLTGDLPSGLADVDTKLTRAELKKQKQAKKRDLPVDPPEVIASRRNIFDGDEFDIHRHQSIDLTRVHVGKKDRSIDVKSDDVVRKRTLLLQNRILQEEEEEELALLAEMGITDPADLFVG